MKYHKPHYLVQSVSVVITAPNFNPSIIDTKFLINNNIVPSDWPIAFPMFSPEAVAIVFENKVRWMMNDSNLTIVQELDALKQIDEEYEDTNSVFDLAEKYLSAFPYDPYNGVGLNFVVHVDFKGKSPDEWIISKLASQIPTDSLIRIVPRLIFKIDESTLYNISIDSGRLAVQEGNDIKLARTGLVVDVNIHHGGNLDVSGMKEIISNWKESHNRAMEFLENTLGEW